MCIEVELVQQFSVFEAFTREEAAEAIKLCHVEEYPNGVMLFDENAPAEKIFLILEGKISLEKRVQLGRSGSSRQATVSVHGPGYAMGWTSIIPPHVYALSAVCLEPCKVLIIDGQDMRNFITENPAAGLKFMIAMAGIIRGQMKGTTDTLTYFLSIISHELKAPLAAIENYLEILLGGFAGELSGKQQRILERSILRARDLRSLINNILDLARMQPENIQADFAWFDPLEVSTEAIENVLSAAKEKGVTLKVDAAADFEKIVGARRRLLQVLSNLLSNAIKFSPEDSEVTLRLRDEPQELVIEVLDEGIGISADEQAHIFEDFFRGQNIGEATGTGLGLSITKMIVNAHQGKIEVESPYQEGKSGAKFTVVIPRDLATPDMRRREWKSARSKSEA